MDDPGIETKLIDNNEETVIQEEKKLEINESDSSMNKFSTEESKKESQQLDDEMSEKVSNMLNELIENINLIKKMTDRIYGDTDDSCNNKYLTPDCVFEIVTGLTQKLMIRSPTKSILQSI